MAEETNLMNQPKEEEQFPLETAASGMGDISIREDVLARIAYRAVAEIEGVTLVGKFAITDYIPGATRDQVKGIRLVKNPESGALEGMTLEVRVEYGENMTKVANELQRHVRDTVERMASIKLTQVNVQIVDIFTKDRKEKDKEQMD
ncbi:MAG: Asp23/Gls24 family envelope stress response protein [Candidatus Sumerlaeia bacterium]|nr:Asp23/Gls24 family envelope stress response protein [Candidatus Sumerlaeia bacterium]